jgi:hypothetical protein
VDFNLVTSVLDEGGLETFKVFVLAGIFLEF